MAANLLHVHSLGLTASTTPTLAVNHRRRTSTATSAVAGDKWWIPIFGWSSDADYINDSDDKKLEEEPIAMKKLAAPAKFRPGCFTEEKAKKLRMMTMETEKFNDVMYHSALASRLATDFPHRSVKS